MPRIRQDNDNRYALRTSFVDDNGDVITGDTITISDHTAAGYLQNVVEDTTPQLGGTLDGNGFNFNGAVGFEANAGEALSRGDAVYVSGVSGNKPIVMKADANNAAKMPAFGIAENDANLNANVEVVTFGTVYNIDTSAYSIGDELYVSTTRGALTATPPTGESAKLQNLGKVIRSHASAGSIKVGGAGRTNAVPNLNDGNVFIGNASNQAEQRALVEADISDFGTYLTSYTETDTLATVTARGNTTSENIRTSASFKAGDGESDEGFFTGQRIYRSSTGGSGLNFTNISTIRPTDNAGTNTNGTISLGESNYKFNNGQFSGNVTAGNLKVSATNGDILTLVDTNLTASGSNIGNVRIAWDDSAGTRAAYVGPANSSAFLINNEYGSVKLTSAGSTKLTTVSAGVDVTGDLDASGSVTSEGPDGGMVMRNWPSAPATYGMIGTANMGAGEYALLTDGTDTFVAGGSGGSTYIRNGANDTSPQLIVKPASVDIEGAPLNTNNDVNVSGGHIWSQQMIRASGWWNTNGSSSSGGLATEIGVSGGASYILSYDRGASAYGDLNITAASLTIDTDMDLANGHDVVLPANNNNIRFEATNVDITANSGRSGVVRFNNTASDTWTGFSSHTGGRDWQYLHRDTDCGLYDNTAGQWKIRHNTGAGTLFYYGSNLITQTTIEGTYTDGIGTFANASGPAIKISDTSGTGATNHNSWLSFRDSGGTEVGYVGYGSGGDADLSLSNYYNGNVNIQGNKATVITSTGYIDIGSLNTSHAHFYTDRGSYYFNKLTYIDGSGLRGYDSSTDCRFPIYYDLNDTAYYSDPASTSRLNISYNNETSHHATNGRGVRFWNSDSYKIYMSQTANATWGGQANGQDTSDYNMYFKMTGGTNRGFVFLNPTTGKAAAIDGAGRGTFEQLYIHNGQGGNEGLQVGSQYLDVKYNATGAGGIRLYDSESVLQGYWYANGAGEHGLLDNDGAWAVRIRTGTNQLRLQTDNNNECMIYTSYVRAVGSCRSPIFYDFNNTSYYAHLDSTGDSIRTAGDIVAYYSDERLKDIEGPIENALDKVATLNGFYYRGNKKAQKLGYDDKLKVGLSAQEVQKVLPEVIKSCPADNQYMTLDYSKVVPLLVEAIKELKSEIEELKK